MGCDSFYCIMCKKENFVKHEVGTGYARDKHENKICYECCGVIDRKHMDDNGKTTLYLSKDNEGIEGVVSAKLDKWYVSNWSGTLKIYVDHIRKGKHNIAKTRYDVWFRDHKGNKWHGVQYGEWTQLCHCKKLKGN